MIKLLLPFATISVVSAFLFEGACLRWYDNQPDPTEIMQELEPCPRYLDISAGWPELTPEGFEPDSGCRPNKLTPTNCLFHPTAFACYRWPTPSEHGHGQQCCYDEQAKLMVGPPGGGTLDMAHTKVQFGIPHAIDDVLPYVYCAWFSQNVDKYYEKRPSDDGSRWKPLRSQ